LEEAEYIASCDPLTGLGSRPWVEGQLQQRINAAQAFCAVMIDIDEFKRVNDDHGHLVGRRTVETVCRGTALGLPLRRHDRPLGR